MGPSQAFQALTQASLVSRGVVAPRLRELSLSLIRLRPGLQLFRILDRQVAIHDPGLGLLLPCRSVVRRPRVVVARSESSSVRRGIVCGTDWYATALAWICRVARCAHIGGNRE